MNEVKKEEKKIERYSPAYVEGLNNKQVESRKEDGLVNKVKDYTKKQYFQIVIKNLFTFYNILLFGIGVLLILAKEYLNCFFLVVVFSNTMLGLIQDIRAKNKLDKLTLIDNPKTHVVRNREVKQINVEELVLDDVMLLKNGDQVPCDSVILYGNADLDEAILTGESLPLHKSKGERLLSGSYILSGEVYARVEATGKDNYTNQLQAKTREFKAPKSQLFIQLNRLFKGISLFVILIGALTVLSKGLFDDAFGSWEGFIKNVAPIAGALISMIPSGMYLLISTTLTVGVINLSGKRVLISEMYSIETLARVDTLCIDKTGTITDGNMSVYQVNNLNSELFNDDKLDIIISSYLAALNDDNFTSKALINYFNKKAVYERINSLPFNSNNKYSSAQLEEIGTITIGAYGFVPLYEADEVIENMVKEYSDKGYRVLVVGYSKEPLNNGKSPLNMEPIALIIMQDHIRKNALEIITNFRENNVNVKVISGDNPLTVKEIAKKVGIENADQYISLEGLSCEEVKEAALKYNVFGRVSPEQKEIIVSTLKEQKHTVAMFGDGVNDILAMKASDVGITVGVASKAAKDVSSIILYNNDFSSLPEVINQGRRVINNLQRTCSLFLIKTLFAMVVNVFFLITSLTELKLTYPFEPRNFYGWDVMCVGVAAFFLALEKNEDKLVKGSFLRNIFKNATLNGLLIALEVVLLFLVNSITHSLDAVETRTIAIYFMAIASFVSLAGVSFPFNWYRSIIFSGAIIGTTTMFTLSYISSWNIVGIDKNVSIEKLLIQVTLMVLILVFGVLAGYLIPYYIKKRKGKNND